MSDTFLRYVGPSDVHDATVERVERDNEVVRVRMRGDQGYFIDAEFHGVTQVLSAAPEGMVLYAISEIRSDGPQRRFVFANWYEPDEEQGKRQLEILADKVDFSHHAAPSSTA